MSDAIKHECGIAVLRLLKPLQFYKDKYGTSFYGINKMYLMMEKQHNRGQDGAGFASIKFNDVPGTRYISRIRSNKSQPIQDIFQQINERLNEGLKDNPKLIDDVELQKQELPYLGELFLGHVRYGTFGKNSLESVHPFLRQSNWKHKNLIVAGNFNMTNSDEILQELIDLGQHPKEHTDTVTVMEKIGHFLDDEVAQTYQKFKEQGVNKKEASPLIGKELNIQRILERSSKNWDGGYAIAGLIGHGDAFVFRDPAGIRPVYFYKDDEIVIVASERPVIQTVFNVPFEKVEELAPAHALIIKKDGKISVDKIKEPLPKRACSFERIYFSRGSDAEIYKERKHLGKLIFTDVLKSIGNDIKNTVFSYIPNTAETSFFGMTEAAEDFLNQQKLQTILKGKRSISAKDLNVILSERPRIEKIAIKDVKLRTFIADDSIVRGTTLKKSIIKIVDRLHPKKIVVVSSAPQIRYPDCYGIDMARLEDFIAFKATLALLKETNQYHIIDEVYKNCKNKNTTDNVENFVKAVYKPFTDVENLHIACPKNLGDWYFTGNYPTKGGIKVVNNAFINFYEGNKKRAY